MLLLLKQSTPSAVYPRRMGERGSEEKEGESKGEREERKEEGGELGGEGKREKDDGERETVRRSSTAP